MSGNGRKIGALDFRRLLRNYIFGGGWDIPLLKQSRAPVQAAEISEPNESTPKDPTKSTPKESTEATKPTEPTLPTEPTDIVDEFFDDLPFDSIEDEITGHPCQVV